MREFPNNSENTNHFQALDSLRGLAALLVVFYHIPAWNELLTSNAIRNGYLMVDLFFVLSGFVIGGAYVKNIRTPTDLLRFQWLRFGRIYPLHALFLLLFLAIEILRFLVAGKTGAGQVRVQAFSVNSLEAFVQQVFLVQAIGPTGNAFTFNRPAWSISVEFYIYILFGVLALLDKMKMRVVFFLISGLSILALATNNSYGWEELLRGSAGFFLGALIADARRARWFPKFSWLFSTVVALSFVSFLLIKERERLDSLVFFFAALLIASLAADGDRSPLNRFLMRPVLVYLGKISYSIYMCHAFVIWVGTTMLKYFLSRPERLDSDGSWILQLSSTDAALSILMIVSLTLALASILYHYVEQPLRARSRAFINKSSHC